MSAACPTRGALVALVLLAAACDPGERQPPRPNGVVPARLVEGAAAEVTIRGGGFSPRVFTDFGSASSARVDEGFFARLGTTPLRGVRLQPDGTLSATVPEGLAPGSYDLTVSDPWGLEGTLPKALRVLSVDELAEAVAGYRFDPIGPQQAGVPFTVTVHAVDAQGLEVPYFNGELELSGAPGAPAPAVAGSFVLGRWSGSVEVGAPDGQQTLVARDALGREARSEPFAVSARQPGALRFVSPPRRLLAGGCSEPVEVALLDEGGFELRAGAARQLGLAAEPADGLVFYSDSSCEIELTGLELPSGESRTRFHFRGVRAGQLRIEASAESLSSDSQLETVQAATPVAVAFATGVQSVEAGLCSQRVVLESRDGSGNAAVVDRDTRVALSAAPSDGFGFFADSACAQPLAEVSIDAGRSSAAFFFKGTRAGEVAMAASAESLGAASQAATVVPAAPAALVFVSAAQTLTVEACSQQATVEARDGFGNPSSLRAGATLALAASAGSGIAFSAAAGCAEPAAGLTAATGTLRLGFWFRGPTPGDHQLTASISGLSPATQRVRLTPPPPDRIEFVSPARSAAAGVCSPALTVQARDPAGVPRQVAADTSVALSAPAGSALQFFGDPTCARATGAAIIAAGDDSATFWFRGTRAGSWAATASVDGWTPGTQAQQVTAAGAERLGFTTPPRSAMAGRCSQRVEVAFEDVWGNPSPEASPRPISLVASPPAGFRLFADAECSVEIASGTVAAGQSAFGFHFLGTRAGQVTVAAMASGFSPASQLETVQATLPDRLGFLTPERELTAGSCSPVLIVQAQDSLGNPVAVDQQVAVALTGSGPDLGFYSDGSCAVALAAPALQAGHDALSFYVRATAAGPATVTAAAFGVSVSQPLRVSPGVTARLSFDPIASPQARNAPFAVAVSARDAWGNLTPDFGEPATLLVAPAGSVSCFENCLDAATSAPFASGRWEGEVAVATDGAARRLVAVAGALSATSNSFDVAAGPARSAPLARLAPESAAVAVGAPVVLDARRSFDYQSATLEASWDPYGSAAGAAPWAASPWTAGLSASASWGAAGLYQARVALRDADGDVGYGAAAVLAVEPQLLCVVTTPSAEDDGASACDAPGPDGVLSLDEAVRLANGSAVPLTIAFAGPLEISGTQPVAVTAPVNLAGGAGVVLGRPLSLGADTTIVGLELSGQATRSVVAAGARLTAWDLYLHEAAGFVVRGAATLVRARMSGCTTDCIADDGGSALEVIDSEIRGSPSRAGIALETCAAGAAPVVVRSTVFSDLGWGLRARCNRTMVVQHATFDANERGLEYLGGAGHLLENAIFTRQRVRAVGCGSAGFERRRYSLAFGNADDGCLSGDPGGLSADPRYVLPAVGDWRLQEGSPAVDSAAALGLDLDGVAPGEHLGAGPDRGGRESL